MRFLNEIIYKRLGSVSHSQYPLSIPLFRNNFDIHIENQVILISGDNGSGKSTLLELLAHECEFNVNGGNSDHLYDGSKDSKQLDLLESLKFDWRRRTKSGFFVRAESFSNFADFVDEQAREWGEQVAYSYYGGKSLHSQSHGESFLSLFSNRFDKAGIYILDEPEAALSPQKILSFMALLKGLCNSNIDAQFFISTHSPLLMSYPYAQLFYFSEDGLKETEYTETEHYQITKNFLNCPDRYFKYLFD
jgi:predicted ATPase